MPITPKPSIKSLLDILQGGNVQSGQSTGDPSAFALPGGSADQGIAIGEPHPNPMPPQMPPNPRPVPQPPIQPPINPGPIRPPMPPTPAPAPGRFLGGPRKRPNMRASTQGLKANLVY